MKLSDFIQKNKAPIRFSMFLSSFIAMGFVLADGHHYTYPSETFNDSQSRNYASDTSRTRTYRTTLTTAAPVQTRYYSYPPLTQEIGSNPFVHSPQYKTPVSYPDDIDANYNTPDLSSVGYSYLPPIQQPGSNPFFRNQNQYAGSYYKAPPRSKALQQETAVVDKPIYDQAGAIYTYPPLTKKLGSNPFRDPARYQADNPSETSENLISEADQKKYRYLDYYQPKPRYIESDNSFMSYTDTHLMYP